MSLPFGVPSPSQSCQPQIAIGNCDLRQVGRCNCKDLNGSVPLRMFFSIRLAVVVAVRSSPDRVGRIRCAGAGYARVQWLSVTTVRGTVTVAVQL
jgi:hypothetical protein